MTEAEPLVNKVNPAQYDFCDISEIKSTAIIGAKGSGKTFTGPRFIARCVDSLPGSKGIFACSTNRQTEDIFTQDIQPLFDQLHWPYEWNQTKGIVHFGNKSVLHLRSAESPDRIESIAYDWGWQDEVSLSGHDFAKTIKSRIRGINGTGHKRFTSMPDDPEHFIYTWLESICDSFYELTLYDNLDKQFVRNYEQELKETYHGDELKRLLTAVRVSLAGQNLFNIKTSHRKELPYNPAEDLYFFWDFNVIYRAVTVWQLQGKTDGVPVLGCIHAYQMNEATTYEDAVTLSKAWSHHKERVFLHGDASGDNRTASTSSTMWQQVRKALKDEFKNNLRYIVPRSNPNVKNTIQVLNWGLTNDKIFFDPAAAKAFRSVAAAKADKYGEIDKKMDDSPDGANTHEMDTVRYAAHHFLEKYLPGGGNKSKITKLRGL